MQTPDGHSKVELTMYHTPAAIQAEHLHAGLDQDPAALGQLVLRDQPAPPFWIVPSS
jgi:hypothetical protein